MLKKLKFFSISVNSVKIGAEIPYDLYVNSSAIEGKERYHRIFRQGNKLTEDFFRDHLEKHTYLYVLEKQRKAYLNEILDGQSNEISKVEIIKNIALEHMVEIFENTPESENEILAHLDKSVDIVDTIVDLIQHKTMNDLHQTISELNFHDTYTYDHSINVCMYSIIFYKFLKPQASRFELATAGLSGLLHDLGKLKVSNKILNNVGKLNEWDFAIIKKHPTYGYELLKDCNCQSISKEMLAEIQNVILQHHENVNGTGYPKGLESGEITFLSKMVAIIDFFDAVTTKRSYHEPLSIKDALSLMKKSMGTKIDGNLFNEFRRSIFVLSEGREDIYLDDDFDPCMPYKDLPIVKIPPKKTNISLRDERDISAQVKLIDPRKKAA